MLLHIFFYDSNASDIYHMLLEWGIQLELNVWILSLYMSSIVTSLINYIMH